MINHLNILFLFYPILHDYLIASIEVGKTILSAVLGTKLVIFK